MSELNIQHVSDTAKWIAAYRALESERDDAIFKDEFAAKLAGPQGFKIVAETPNSEAMAFAMVARTSAIDNLVHIAVQKSIDTVINLGAGLDTRPYRMKLPSALNWIEVDFSNMIHYKNEALKNDQPVCKLNRIAADLTNDLERITLFQQLGKKTKKALIITEGVIGYLTNGEAQKLSQDLFAVPSFQYWIMDYSQGRFRQNKMSKKINKNLVHAPWLFTEAQPIQFFERTGWRVEENIYILDEADRFGRKVPLKFPYSLAMTLFPRKIRELGNKTYGFVLFKRQGA